MKTNQNLIRKMGEFDVIQRTSDGMFNATTLLKAWNNHSGHKKKVAKYFENPSTKEFIQAIVNEELPSYAKNGDDKKYLILCILNLGQTKGIMLAHGCTHYYSLTSLCGSIQPLK